MHHGCQNGLICIIFSGAQIGGDQRRRVTRCLNLQFASFDGARLKQSIRITSHDFDMSSLLCGSATLNQDRRKFCFGINFGRDLNCTGLDSELRSKIALALQSPFDLELRLDLRIKQPDIIVIGRLKEIVVQDPDKAIVHG
ncbi:MAG: hypothetical protein C0454_17435 [Parvibaculum sp.]|nr:hypothetical protein [Parvibaculum sp.]